MLLFLPLQPQNLVLSSPELLPGGVSSNSVFSTARWASARGSFGLLLLGLQGSFLGG